MKRVVAAVFVFVLGGMLLAQGNIFAAEESSYWEGQTTIEEIGPTSKEEINLPPYCSQATTYVTRVERGVESTLNARLSTQYKEAVGEDCHVTNNQGSFALGFTATWSIPRRTAGYYQPSGDLSQFIKWSSGSGVTNWREPAPQGNVVLQLYRDSQYDKSYKIKVHKNLKDWGKVVIDNSYLEWAVDLEKFPLRDTTILTYDDGRNVGALAHSFSRNGRYLAVQNSEGIFVVDLVDLSRTLVYGFPIGQKVHSLAVDSRGEHLAIATSLEDVKVLDLTGCNRSESFGSWQREFTFSAPRGVYPGCRVATELKPELEQRGLIEINTIVRGLYFNEVGNELFFSIRSDEYTPENPVFDYTWTKYKTVALDYESSNQGYLALGDSYSSGEGDNEGGTWYEPGTDEQGDASSFAGRNLCHLSRRSYPYLIGLELGFLETNTSSPPSDGLFHSVACSGAKVHNVIGGGGEKQDAGAAWEFAETDNQYRFDRTAAQFLWQPGITKQTSALEEWSSPDSDIRYSFYPEIITIGIGGNDAGFGDFLKSCVAPGTCEVAQPGTDEATHIGVLIAQQKFRLTKAFKNLKQQSPEARIYVHGYPVFVRPTGGSCGANVRLDDQERQFAAGAIGYTNQVIEAAAKEAGVHYADVSNIFEGGRLCDEGPEKFMNGATAGNDGIKFIVRNVLGNESYHPNANGFERYKTSLLQLTNNFEIVMPSAEHDTPIPLPQEALFGAETQGVINDMNDKYSPGPEKQTTSDGIIISSTEAGNEFEASYDGFYPGSEAEIEIHSEPISLGAHTVDQTGNLRVAIALPELAPGYHELHIKGFDTFGNRLDAFQSFVLASSQEDFDGDGVVNEDDSCPQLADSGIDIDQDGVDDGCDNYVAIDTRKRPGLFRGVKKIIRRVLKGSDFTVNELIPAFSKPQPKSSREHRFGQLISNELKQYRALQWGHTIHESITQVGFRKVNSVKTK